MAKIFKVMFNGDDSYSDAVFRTRDEDRAMDNEEIISNAIDHLLAAHDRKVCAEIDAGACRTEHDFRRMHRAVEAFEEEREKCMATLVQLLKG